MIGLGVVKKEEPILPMTSISVHVDSSTAKDEHGLEVVTQPDGGGDDGWTDEARSELTTALSKEDRKEKIVDDLFAEMDPTKKSPRKKGKGKGKGKGKRKSDSKRPASSVADFSSSRMTVKPSFEVDNYFGQDGLGDMDDDDDDDDDGWADDDDVDEEDIKRIEREAQAKQREERRRALDAERERKRLEKESSKLGVKK